MFAGGSWHLREYIYDVLNRVTVDALYKANGSLDRQSTFEYAGREIKITDANGNERYNYFDVRGKLGRIKDPTNAFTYSRPYSCGKKFWNAGGCDSRILFRQNVLL